MPAPRPLNVLIVDDRTDDHALFQEYLSEDKECDYRFFNAYNGKEAEQLFARNKVDCILLDYNLPDTNGIEVLKRLSEKHDVVPAIMLTGEGSESLAVVAMKTGMQDYIPKRVVTSEALCRTVSRAVERSEMMRQVEHYRQDLERSNQDLERFANVVAHDLKAPLRAITQHLQLIKECSVALEEDALTSLRFACEGAGRMHQLIEALLGYSKAGFEKRAFSPVALEKVLEAAKQNLSSSISETRACILCEGLPLVTADFMQMIQLLQNLIGNAVKYCKSAPEVRVTAKQEGDVWLISVQDNGIGIPAAALQQIFTIFKRLHTEEDYPGTGVGLAICERIVGNHGGRIWAESKVGKGSHFFFTLPVREERKREKIA